MNYRETLEYLTTLGKFGIHLGLERIEGILAILGNPQQQFKTVHITGTNGKGSVSEFVTGALADMGLKVGCFTSPHFVKYNERIAINGQDISDEDFAALATIVAAAEKEFKEQGGEQPTQFEILTAMCFVYFAKEKVDYGVVEVGMGGLWDSTNVIVPQVSVITNVAMDHMARLGNTIREIAAQKAGIIKEGVPVVTGATGQALKVILGTASEKHAPIRVYGNDFTGVSLESNMDKQIFAYRSLLEKREIAITLAGDHQIINCSVAIATLEVLAKQDKKVNLTGLEASLFKVKWPGRLERIRRNPDVLLDGAHNPAGITVLRKTLDEHYYDVQRCFVFGMMKDKDLKDAAEILFRPKDIIFTVRADDGPRAASAEYLAENIGRGAKAFSTLTRAYQNALEVAGDSGVVCVCGSLYLVGTFKETLQKG